MRGKGMISVLAFAVISIIFLPSPAQGRNGKKPRPGEISPAPIPSPQIQPLPSQTPTVQEPPRVTYFQINRGQESTISQAVTLNFTAERASQYRASERQDFAGAQWKYMTTPPTYTLSFGDGRKTVYLQVKGAMDRVSAVVSDSISLQMTPRVTSFSVHRWYAKGAGSSGHGCNTGEKGIYVITRTSVSTRPTEYRIGEDPSFTNRPWKQWGTHVTLTDREGKVCIPRGTGTRTVYLQVKNSSGTSGVATATFQVPPQNIFVLDHLDDEMIFGKNRGFKFGAKPLDVTSRCEWWESINRMQARGSGEKELVIAIPAGLTGSRCDFTLFDGRSLNAGWKFKNYSSSHPQCEYPGRGFSVNERPSVDSRQIRFRVHLWADPGKKCSWMLGTLTLEGPGDGYWTEAFE